MAANKLYEGKAKILYSTDNPDELIQYFKDSATAFNGVKKAELDGKGVVNNAISTYIMEYLGKHNIDTHFIQKIDEYSQLVKKVSIVPLEVIIRNKAAGSFCKRYGVKDGLTFKRPLLEFCLKDDALGDPFISDDHIDILDLASPEDLKKIKEFSYSINEHLKKLFLQAEIDLIDFKLEFGKTSASNYRDIVLADEISPDSCRLWDLTTGERMDKDRFRLDLGDTIEFYRQIAKRLKI